MYDKKWHFVKFHIALSIFTFYIFERKKNKKKNSIEILAPFFRKF